MTDEKIKITDEYYNYYYKYTKKYGLQTVILMQVGMFYEMYMSNENNIKIGNADEISKLLNIQLTLKNKKEEHSKTNAYMCGFPKSSLIKNLSVFLDNNYTVVIIDQEENKKNTKRFVKDIYSPGIQPLENIENDYQWLISLLIEYNKFNKNESFNVSICCINLSLNNFEIYEFGLENVNKNDNFVINMLENVYRILYKYNYKEIIINLINFNLENFKDILNLYNTNYHINYIKQDDIKLKKYVKIDYQNEFFKKIYKHINFGLLTPIEYFNLEKYSFSITNCIYILNFIYDHNQTYLNNLQIPQIINEYGVTYCKLELNTLQQLNVINSTSKSNGSLFDIINKTKTIIGKRYLRNVLCNPYKNIETIKDKLEISEQLSKLDLNIINKYLEEIIDLTKIHRKILIENIKPKDIYNLYISYQNVLKIIEYLESQDDFTHSLKNINFKDTLKKFLIECEEIFNINNLKNNNYINYIKNNATLETLNNKIQNINKNVNEYIEKITKNDNTIIKQLFDNQDG